MSKTLLLFGATGDLARRMLLPSLYNLDSEGLLGDLKVVATARSELDDAGYKGMVRKALADHGAEGDVGGFLERFGYQTLDVNDSGHFDLLAKRVGTTDELAIFLST